MRRLAARVGAALLLLACEGDPVGEAKSDGGSGGSATGGAAGAQTGGAPGGGAAGTGATGGSAGGAATGGTSGGGTGGGGTGGTGGVEILVPASPNGARGLALDASHAYYGSGTELRRVPKAGGASEPVATGLVGPREIALGSTQAFFLDGDKRLYAVAKGGGTPLLLWEGSSFEQYGDLATDDAFVYWTSTLSPSSFDGEISRIPVTGGSPTTLASPTSSGPVGIALQGGTLYWSESLTESVHQMPAAGGGSTLLTSGLSKPGLLAVGATWIYFAETNATAGFAPSTGGAASSIEANGPAHDIAIDDQNAYFTLPANGALVRSGLGTTKSLEIVKGWSSPWSVAVDETHVVFTNYGGGDPAVARLAK